MISPKRKNAILDMALKSLIISKLDHHLLKSLKWFAAGHVFETITKFDRLKNGVLDCSAKDRISAKTF